MKLKNYLLTAGAFLLVIATSVVATTRTVESQASGSFASVNIGRCVADSKVQAVNISELQGMQGRLQAVLQQLEQNGANFLSAKEAEELAKLYEKTTLSGDEKKRVAALEAIAAKKRADLKVLDTTPNPNEAQKKQMEDLLLQQENGMKMLQGIQEAYKDTIEKRDLELSQKFDNDLRGAITKVAQDKGIAIVFDNKAAVYAGNDITNDVIKIINK
jgi:Skp family chaperone for outer membrane proteins